VNRRAYALQFWEKEMTASRGIHKKPRGSYLNHPIADDPDAFIRVKQLARLNNVHPATIRRWVNEGRLPPPERRSTHVVGWTRRTLAEHHARTS
jgi:predicted DNA-binding transcriptional regulator AlpA